MISSIRLNAGSGNFRKAVAKSWIPIGLAGACVVMLHPAQCQYIAWHLSTRASFATSLLPRRRSLLRSGRYIVVCFVVGRARQRPRRLSRKETRRAGASSAPAPTGVDLDCHLGQAALWQVLETYSVRGHILPGMVKQIDNVFINS